MKRAISIIAPYIGCVISYIIALVISSKFIILILALPFDSHFYLPLKLGLIIYLCIYFIFTVSIFALIFKLFLYFLIHKTIKDFIVLFITFILITIPIITFLMFFIGLSPHLLYGVTLLF